MTAIHEDAATGSALADLRDEPREVRQALTALGRLLGAALIDPPRDLKSFVSEYLQVPTAEVAVVAAALRGIDAPLVYVAVGRLLDGARNAVLTDDLGNGAPGYQLVAVDVDDEVAAPDDLAAFIPAGEAFDFDVIVVLTWEHGFPKIAFNVRREDSSQARSALSALIERARTTDNFYRGKTLQVVADKGIGLTPVKPSSVKRSTLEHTAKVWAEIDANVGGLARHGAFLAEAGLGASRGILIVGPPGVGKTALCRVIAGELPPETTILIVDATTTARGLGRIYEALERLAPAAVFLDDIDLLAGDRRTDSAGPMLREFLTHLDGFTPAAAVITVATTNVTATIDPALMRPGRFDSVIEVGLPTAAAREQILARYLRALGRFDLGRVAAACAGASGADLREIVRRAVLERGRELTESDLLDVVRTGRWKPAPLTGQYL